MLRMALELAEDVAGVYQTVPVALKRGFNQAFFKRIKVVGRRDNGSDELAVRIVDGELTEPYKVLLAEGFAEQALAQTEHIRDGHQKRKATPPGSPSCGLFRP